MQKIIPHLWFDKEAKEAAAFYATVFPESEVTHTTVIRDTPSGDCDVVGFKLWNKEFMAISAGPLFKPNPSISFIVNFDPLLFGGTTDEYEAMARHHLDAAWEKLTGEGKVMMPLGTYPFSKHYGWVQDKYGISWQLMLSNPFGMERPAIIPSIMFAGGKAGKAEEALDFYSSVFRHSEPGDLHRYPAGAEPDREGTIMFADRKVEDLWLAAMDSAHEHGFDFNEAISFLITCADQQEIDEYWNKLSAVPESEQCGWLKDKYGLSWQISAADLESVLREGKQDQVGRIMNAVMNMKKLDLEKIKAAAGKG